MTVVVEVTPAVPIHFGFARARARAGPLRVPAESVVSSQRGQHSIQYLNSS
jgi:hypothetical protein